MLLLSVYYTTKLSLSIYKYNVREYQMTKHMKSSITLSRLSFHIISYMYYKLITSNRAILEQIINRAVSEQVNKSIQHCDIFSNFIEAWRHVHDLYKEESKSEI